MKTAINIKTDKSVKKDAQKLAEELGLSLSAVVNASLKEFVRNRSVYFSAMPRMSEHLERVIEIAEHDLAAGTVRGPFRNVKDFIADLKS